MNEVDDVIARLGAKTKSRVKQASEIEFHRQEVPSVGLNLGLNGGIGYGRQTLIWGNKSASKTSFSLQLIAKAQEDNKVCAFVDAENSYDTDWARGLGVDNERLIYTSVKTIADMTDVCVDLMKNGVDLIVVDSISALLPGSYFSKDDELKDLDKTNQIGAHAKDLASAMKMFGYINEKTAIVLISQVRNQINSYGAQQAPEGGFAVKFFSSTVIKLWSSAREDVQIVEERPVGDRLLKMPVAREVQWLVEFNKIGKPNQVGKYTFYYDGEVKGIDKYGEIVNLAEKYGIVRKAASWYYVYDEKLQGERKAAQYLRDNPEVFDKVLGELNDKL